MTSVTCGAEWTGGRGGFSGGGGKRRGIKGEGEEEEGERGCWGPKLLKFILYIIGIECKIIKE